MELADNRESGSIKKAIRFLFHRSRFRKWMLLLILALLVQLAVIVGCLYYGMVLHKYGGATTIREWIENLPKTKLAVAPNYLKGLTSAPERITIDIGYINYQKLAHNRQIALGRGCLLPDARDEVAATITYNNKPMNADIRLKGDNIDHWNDEYKWSFRIRIRGENTILGMKQFSIQRPRTRGYLNEWVFHELLKYEDLISLRYDFIEVVVNGRDLGIYAIEEHFEDRLIEHNKRRAGPIIRFDDYLLWGGFLPDDQAFAIAPIDAFQTRKIMQQQTYRNQFIAAKDLLESFRMGKLGAASVFDLEQTAVLFAIVDLLGHHHSTAFRNIRFYYNPVTSLLEPIGYDNQGIMDAGIEMLEGENTDKNTWISLFLKDRDFFVEYVRALERISRRDFLDRFFEDIRIELNEKLGIIYKSFPAYRFEGEEILYRNQQYIRDVLNPERAIQAYFGNSHPDYLTIELANIHTLPVEVTGLSFRDSLRLRPSREIILPSKNFKAPVSFENAEFLKPQAFVWSDTMAGDLKIHYRLLGSNDERSESIFPWSHLTEDFAENDFIRRRPNFDRFEFIMIDHAQNHVFLKPGDWSLSDDLIIPAGYLVICGADTRLNFSGGAKILSYSPFRFSGTKDSPIVFYSDDSSGQGIAVFEAETTSILKHVVFDNLSNLAEGGWELTGAVTFYKSPVVINSCRFMRSRSEDALNIISSKFRIENTNFGETESDAVDADFSEGEIVNSSFFDCGNDAVDISGSEVTVSGIVINRTGDKGISVGENSYLTASQVRIGNCPVGIASKDLSQIVIEDIEIFDSRVGLAAYKKKSEFGSASIRVKNLKIDNVEMPYLIERGSIITVDDREIKPNRENLGDFLYEIAYGSQNR